MLTFKANYISPATIVRINNSNYGFKQVSFVEIDPMYKNDRLSVNKAAVSWDRHGGEGFAYDICEALNQIYCSGQNNDDKRFFAITTQRNDFERLAYDDILALAQVTTPEESEYHSNSKYIDFLQIDPEYQKSNVYRTFKGVGTAMLNSIKKLYNDKNILLDSVESAIEFYTKNGFKEIESLKMIFRC